MKKNTPVIILSAGQVSPEMSSVFGDIPSGMIPVNGKPALALIIDDLLADGFQNFVVVVGYNKDVVRAFLSLRYQSKCQIEYIEADHRLAPGNSLVTALEKIDSQDLLVVLGDTICREKLILNSSFVMASREYLNTEHWCLVDYSTDGSAIRFIDKPHYSESGSPALIGIYYFKHLPLLKKCCSQLDITQRIELSRILERYMESEQIRVMLTNNWIDIGHLAHYHEAKIKLINARHFNQLTYDQTFGTLTKTSKNVEKFRDEILWYSALPVELQVLAPRIITSTLEPTPNLTMEYYGYPSLSELFIYGQIHHKIWEQIIAKIIRILLEFNRFHTVVPYSDYQEIYINKTSQRLSDLGSTDPIFSEILKYSSININGLTYDNIQTLEPLLEKAVRELYDTAEQNNSLLHGDYCLSNILYDLRSGIIRLIDPRGRWGSSLAGDIRYDVAKLRHSIAGKYESIINDFFTAQRFGNVFHVQLFNTLEQSNLSALLDQKISEHWNLQEIKFIEGLLFISMVPLHRDYPARQLAMYCAGIQLLNEVFKKDLSTK